ncbi:hypothetical protein PENSPDRAFT_578322 [Peniophora sp. CONT]|nr:hypothetical protein PENSPDRAFT_578322 [Peniophora sp. CONT]
MANSTPSPSSSGTSGDKRKSTQVLNDKGKAPEASGSASSSTPEVHVNGSPVRGPTPRSTRSVNSNGSDEAQWGANFWVTLVDPSSGTSFFACPATGEVSWDAPVGNFVLPANENGEWWEIIDESTGVPYYYHTKTSETVWEKPEGFVIPLSVLQVRCQSYTYQYISNMYSEHRTRTSFIQNNIARGYGSLNASGESKEFGPEATKGERSQIPATRQRIASQTPVLDWFSASEKVRPRSRRPTQSLQ